MLVIDEGALNRAAEFLMIAARTAKDQGGLMVSPMLPVCAVSKRTTTADSDINVFAPLWDMPRIQAIALAAVVSLVGGPCSISGQVPVSLSSLTTKDTV
jgi:hypothetical protein